MNNYNLNSILNQFKDADPDGVSIPKALVEKMLETTERLVYEKGQKDERAELICRLLANDMPADMVSLILKIRVEEIKDVEKYNGEKIKDYAKKLKTRRKSRERLNRKAV